MEGHDPSVCRPIASPLAPAAIGPYSQAVAVDGFLFVSGQLPIDPATGELVQGGIAAQTHQILKNIGTIAQAAGTELRRTVKTTVFITDLDGFAEMNEAYAQYFGPVAPARSTVQVVRLPKGADVEIEALVRI